MFTGIIRNTAKVNTVSRKKGSIFITIDKPKNLRIKKGDSVAVNGICSTITGVNLKTFRVEYMPETIKKTTVGNFRKGTVVNIERPVQPSEFLDGHIVQGHIDTTGEVISIKSTGRSRIIKVRVPLRFMNFIVPQGSIAVDGVSITVAAVGRNWFKISLVDYTVRNTHFGILRNGSIVNIETDIIAKYVQRLKI